MLMHILLNGILKVGNWVTSTGEPCGFEKLTPTRINNRDEKVKKWRWD